jgi:hypothetical protein
MSSQKNVGVSRGPVEEEYQVKLAGLNRRLSQAQSRQFRALVCLAGCALLAIFALSSRHFSWFAAIPASGMAWCVWDYLGSRRAALHIALSCGFYERGLERIRMNWEALVRTGEEFAQGDHLYQYDLQILGERSLFSLLCTTRSEAGAARLADYLLKPVTREEVIARQCAVQELRARTALREAIALVGRHHFLECDPKLLGEWINTPLLCVPAVIPVCLLLFGAANLLLVILCFAQLLTWIQAAPIVIPLSIAQGILCCPLFRGVRSRLRLLRRLRSEVSVLQQGLHLLEGQQFASPKLAALVSIARASNAARCLFMLDRLLRAIGQRDKEFFALPSLLTSLGTQLVLAVERWRASNREQFMGWIDIWAEFDALNAIACYAYEHPAGVFPEVVEGPATFQLRNMGHPLLPEDRCVTNDVTLGEAGRFWILSGSNMAGKSTLLKAIGTNIVLACAGAPIRAAYARFSLVSLCASISISDSLLDGKSKFLAEAERFQRIFEKARGERPVLFLIDEILSGTNSHDRRQASLAIVKALIGSGAVGIFSTHDLALTSIADEPGLSGRNYCMESDPHDPLQFDYAVKEGISTVSNAVAVIRSCGLDQLQL